MKKISFIILLLTVAKLQAQTYIGTDFGVVQNPADVENTVVQPPPNYLPMVNVNIGYQKQNLIFSKSITLLESSFRLLNNPAYFGLRMGIGYNIGWGFKLVGLYGGYCHFESTGHVVKNPDDYLIQSYGVRAFWKMVYVEASRVEETNYSIGIFANIRDIK